VLRREILEEREQLQFTNQVGNRETGSQQIHELVREMVDLLEGSLPAFRSRTQKVRQRREPAALGAWPMADFESVTHTSSITS
jgi:hypothetical protein